MPIKCPMCGSERTYKQFRWPFAPSIFGCHSCHWKIAQKDFHTKGGTTGIRERMKKKGRSGGRSHRKHKHHKRR